ncbi:MULTISPECIES: LacI family DNA-binding transcriptional regulator [Vibrio]|uniref:LacI family DNA-binding transcriptional regulator n=1 Tax=Vibrio ostreae TaxID=2841925 RepID=A0A975YND9_9VIBR|nr:MULTISPECIES: LacI family DNA-binding transcriptional regulator [Vibrio]QXO17554.1 LacI family DNA-binding transcriptional regulator [Vibrio ostreae]WGY48134.1 LacI family DNA-binding transcriptional regulator [Vibrio sp. ABG19]
MQRKTRPTLQDIADQVGITKMTVSRYLRDPGSVAQKTQQKIAAVIEELGYIQNRVPAILSKSSSRAIGIILPSLSNQVFAHLVQGIESVTKQAGYDTLIAHTGYSSKEEEEKIAALLSYRVDGLILTETNHTERTLQMLRSAAVPVVETMEIPACPIDMAVGLDHEQTSYEVVQEMLARGRKNIVYLGARLDTRTRLRMQGYERAMRDAGLEPQQISTGEHSSFTIGGVLLEKALAQCPQLDAIFCTNDDVAIGAMMYCAHKGIEVPKQIAVVGYNALDIGQAIIPKLTSVETPRFAIGKKSAELLLAALAGEEAEQKVYDLGYRLTIGDSL